MRLSLLDVQDREVALLANECREPGSYTAAPDAARLRPGLYFVRLKAAGVELKRRAVVVK